MGDRFLFNHISFHMSAHQNPHFTVSIDTGQKVPILKLSKKFVNLYYSDIFWIGWQKLDPSHPNQASKSTFLNFHGNDYEFQNFDTASSPSDPDRLLCPISLRSVEKWQRNQQMKKGLWLPTFVFFFKCPRLPGSVLKMRVVWVWLYQFFGNFMKHWFNGDLGFFARYLSPRGLEITKNLTLTYRAKAVSKYVKQSKAKPGQWFQALFRCRIATANFSMGFIIISPYTDCVTHK